VRTRPQREFRIGETFAIDDWLEIGRTAKQRADGRE
jgi:hypothetical protein